ncbi:MAG: hypothetical protein M1833_001899 [Piccolia ochrophora]|nr:MAG: hypothetical protein M1833_001899 [Piccolia ochrophora]
MSSIESVPSMNAAVLTIMATREQDQNLVAQVANRFGGKQIEADKGPENSTGHIVPSFGWHPWFSYQLFDDSDPEACPAENQDHASWKRCHYKSVLTPPPEGQEFIDSLPEPTPLSQHLEHTKTRLANHPHALIGEVGLDRSFRLPNAWAETDDASRDESRTPGGREGRRLSPHRVSPAHQKRILKAQLHLAGEMQRAVSVHSVQAHGMVFDTLQETWKGYEKEVVSSTSRKRRGSAARAHDHEDKAEEEDAPSQEKNNAASKPFPPRVCMHSYSGPSEPLKQFLAPSVPTDIYFSFSTTINFSKPGSAKAEEVIKIVPADRLLVESDLHCAGAEMDACLEGIVRKICEIRGWNLDDGLQRLGRNWREFVYGASRQDSND